jgi:hypothetical protein
LETSLISFLQAHILRAITASKNLSAVGPDGLTAIHFKHLGPRALQYLTVLFNLSTQRADIPAIWKAAVIILILKSGKSADQGSSYRPISLLCLAVKLLERLLKPYIQEAYPKSHTQHGYVPFHSTTTALLPIATQVAIGFNDPKPARHSAMVIIDISKAFDSIDHTLLIEEIGNTPLPYNYVRWLAAYLRGRTACCLYNGIKSPHSFGYPPGVSYFLRHIQWLHF